MYKIEIANAGTRIIRTSEAVFFHCRTCDADCGTSQQTCRTCEPPLVGAISNIFVLFCMPKLFLRTMLFETFEFSLTRIYFTTRA